MQHFYRKEILETGPCRIVPGFTGPLKAKVSLYFKWNGKPWRDWNREIMRFNFPFIITLWKADCNDASVWSQSLIRHYCFSLARNHRPVYIMEWMVKAVIIFWMCFNSWKKGSGWSSWRTEGEGEWWKKHLGIGPLWHEWETWNPEGWLQPRFLAIVENFLSYNQIGDYSSCHHRTFI